MQISRLNPCYWDDAAALAAVRIDIKRTEGVRHPMYADGELMLAVLREEYDNFAAVNYGAEPEATIASNWFTAMGIMTIDAALAKGLEIESADSLLPLLRSKMEDYGYENIQRFGLDGILVRMHDKIARLQNLLGKSEVNNESVEDNYKDLLGYSIIGWIFMNDLWRLPLKEHADLLA